MTGPYLPYRITYAHPDGGTGFLALATPSSVSREGTRLISLATNFDLWRVDTRTGDATLFDTFTAVYPDDDETRTCAYVYHVGSYTNPPEPCDLDAEEDSEYCARHRATEDGDNSDEPIWAMEEE